METILTLISASIALLYLLSTCLVSKFTKQQTSSNSVTESSGSSKLKRWKPPWESRIRPIPPFDLSIEASYQFALSLLKTASGIENFVISPFSLGAALAIIHDGAKDETQREITLLLSKTLSPSDVSSLYSSLTTALSEKNSAEFPLNTEYQSHIEKMYNASAKNINFKDGDTSANDANSFVNEITRGIIPEVATADDFTDSVAVLINAVYFKGEWNIPFPKSSTQSQPFHGIKGDRDEPFMRSKSRYLIYSHNELSVVSLDYKDNAFSLLVMMPSTDFGEWRTNLTAMQIHKARENLKMTMVELEVPKWKIESSTNGKEALEKCGVTKIFDKTADLSGISDKEGSFISSIVHKAVIEVSEMGTEAAAATKAARSINIKLTIGSPRKLIFDKPFIYFLIREKHILFIGEFC